MGVSRFPSRKVSRVHVSYLLKDHEVVSHANYIAEIIFGLSGDVIETLCEKKDDASDDYRDFASSQFPTSRMIKCERLWNAQIFLRMSFKIDL